MKGGADADPLCVGLAQGAARQWTTKEAVMDYNTLLFEAPTQVLCGLTRDTMEAITAVIVENRPSVYHHR